MKVDMLYENNNYAQSKEIMLNDNIKKFDFICYTIPSSNSNNGIYKIIGYKF